MATMEIWQLGSITVDLKQSIRQKLSVQNMYKMGFGSDVSNIRLTRINVEICHGNLTSYNHQTRLGGVA